jgi:hypothetical protein
MLVVTGLLAQKDKRSPVSTQISIKHNLKETNSRGYENDYCCNHVASRIIRKNEYLHESELFKHRTYDDTMFICLF